MNSSLSVLPVARVQFPTTAEHFKGFFPGWSHLSQRGRKWLNLPSMTQPVGSEEEGRSPTTDRRWLMEKKTKKLIWLRSAAARSVGYLLTWSVHHRHESWPMTPCQVVIPCYLLIIQAEAVEDFIQILQQCLTTATTCPDLMLPVAQIAGERMPTGSSPYMWLPSPTSGLFDSECK